MTKIQIGILTIKKNVFKKITKNIAKLKYARQNFVGRQTATLKTTTSGAIVNSGKGFQMS